MSKQDKRTAYIVGAILLAIIIWLIFRKQISNVINNINNAVPTLGNTAFPGGSTYNIGLPAYTPHDFTLPALLGSNSNCHCNFCGAPEELSTAQMLSATNSNGFQTIPENEIMNYISLQPFGGAG